MPITLDGTNGITTPMYNGSITANAVTPSVNMKNRIINGNMSIDQRNAGASVTQTTNDTYTVDRFYIYGTVTSKFTVQQNAGSVTPPAGFINYLGATSSSAYTVGSSEQFNIQQPIEGLNCTDLGWGTANAKTVTLSFWVRSSLTGTFGGSLRNSAVNRSYPYSYTISAANTWEYKTITIAGDTSGTWLTTNGVGIYVNFSMGAGSTLSGTAGAWAAGNLTSATGATSVVGTNGATFYLTGVQLEVGSTATSFDYRPYGTELALCQRYYAKTFLNATAPANNAGNTGSFRTIYILSGGAPSATWQFPVNMRAAPTITTFNIGAGTSGQWRSLGAGTVLANASTANISENSGQIFNDATTGTSDWWAIHATASAEL